MKQVGYDKGWFHNSRVWTISADGTTVWSPRLSRRRAERVFLGIRKVVK